MASGARDGQPEPATVPPATGRRAEILADATRVLAAKGVLRASSSDIATAAGILSGSLYHHFSSKEQILLEIIQPLAVLEYHHYLAVIKREEAKGSSAAVVLRRLIESTVHDVADHVDVALIVRNDAHQLAAMPALAPVTEFRRSSRQLWCDVIEGGLERGELRAGLRPKEVVAVVLDAVLGTVRWFTGPNPADPADIGARLADLFLAGLEMAPSTDGNGATVTSSA